MHSYVSFAQILRNWILILDLFIYLKVTRNTWKTILRRNVSNPCCLLDAACWMLLVWCLLLRHLGLNQHADFIHSAVINTVIQNKVSSDSLLPSVFPIRTNSEWPDVSTLAESFSNAKTHLFLLYLQTNIDTYIEKCCVETMRHT